MFMASLIPQTRRIMFATGVINLPNRHPAVIAAEAAQFDHMSDGRFMFGIGTGSLPSDYELFDVADARPSATACWWSRLDMIERIWAQDPPYEFNGEFWNFGIKKAISESSASASCRSRCAPGGPPICVAVSSPNSPTAEIAGAARLGSGVERARAGRRGRHPLGSSIARAAARPAACPMAPTGAWSNTCWSPAPTPRRASACISAQSAYRYAFGYLLRGAQTRGPPRRSQAASRTCQTSEVTVETIIESRVIYGSPQTVAEKLLAFREQVGPFGQAAGDRDGLGRSRIERGSSESMRRLAEEVMPLLRRHTTARAAE